MSLREGLSKNVGTASVTQVLLSVDKVKTDIQELYPIVFVIDEGM